jgi:hypothetical protein
MLDLVEAKMNPEMLKTWKVQTTERGVVLTLNGKSYELGSSGSSVAFDLDRAAGGWNPPATERHVAESIDG